MTEEEDSRPFCLLRPVFTDTVTDNDNISRNVTSFSWL